MKKLTLFAATLLLAISAFALSPQGEGYNLVAPATATIDNQTLTWQDDATTGATGYKIEAQIGGKWREIWRGLDPAQRAFAIPEPFKNLSLRVFAFRANEGNGAPTQVQIRPPLPAPVPVPTLQLAPSKYSAPQNLGNPAQYRAKIYARNIWDLQVFDGKLLIGDGDSAANAGPSFVGVFDLTTQQFVTTTQKINTEQIDEFQIIGERLVFGDHDPGGTASAKLHFYDAGTGKWTQNAGLKQLAHIFSVVELEGKIFIAGGNWPLTGIVPYDVWSSKDNGASWQGASPVITTGNFANRTYSLLPLKGHLYALRNWISCGIASSERLYKLNPQTAKFEGQSVTGAQLSPGFTKNVLVRYKRPLALPDGSALSLLTTSANDSQWQGLQLLHIRGFTTGAVSQIHLPEGAVPYDLIRRGETVYVCAWNAQKKQNAVYALDALDLTLAPSEVLRFNAPTFARSFEESGGDFYFGLGCAPLETSAPTGEIWKVSVEKEMKNAQ